MASLRLEGKGTCLRAVTKCVRASELTEQLLRDTPVWQRDAEGVGGGANLCPSARQDELQSDGETRYGVVAARLSFASGTPVTVQPFNDRATPSIDGQSAGARVAVRSGRGRPSAARKTEA